MLACTHALGLVRVKKEVARATWGLSGYDVEGGMNGASISRLRHSFCCSSSLHEEKMMSVRLAQMGLSKAGD